MDRRTALISAASVVGVVLAGATAVAANVGILDRADSSGVGELSASVDAGVVEPQIIDVQLAPDSPTATVVQLDDSDSRDGSDSTQPLAQPFIVEDAGVVAVEITAEGLRLAEVSPNDGWTYLEAETDDGSVSVTFDSGSATYVFRAVAEADGSISASVDEVIIEFVTSPSPSPSSSGSATDDFDDDDDHDDDDDDDDHDDDDRDDDDDDDDRDDDDRDDDDRKGRDDDD